MKKLLFIILLYYPAQAYMQGWSISYSPGYGAYQLDDIKKLQNGIPERFGLKETDYFPNYITHSVSLGYVTGRHHFGSNFTYLTTGGRLHRADYSGSYKVDMIMNGYRLGAFYRYYISTRLKPLSVYFQISPGVLFSNLVIREKITIYSESVHQTAELKGVGIYFEPTIGANYSAANWLQFTFGGGYEIDFRNKMELSGQETQIEAIWNGLRLYAGFIVFPTEIFFRNE